MRERDGTLREANADEKCDEAMRVWGKECVKHVVLPKTRKLRRFLNRRDLPVIK